MFLDAYYKMQFAEVMVRARHPPHGQMGVGDDITALGLRLADGTAYTDWYPGYGASNKNYSYMLGMKNCFNPIYNAMVTQTGTLPASTAHVSNLIIGTGTTPVTAGDYCVEAELLEGVTNLSATSVWDMEKRTVCHTKTIQNSSEEPLTVTEIGLTWPVLMDYNHTVASQILVYREILENPITAAPGESFTVTIRYQFPAAE